MSIKLTPKGKEDLENLIRKKEEELKEFQKYKGEDAIGQGNNWHDNFAFEQARVDEQTKILEIQDLKVRLESAIFIEVDNEETDSVQINSKFSVSFLEKGVYSSPENYLLSESFSPDWLNGEISINSPLGKSVIGKKVGDIIEYKINGVLVKAKLISIN